MIRRFIHRHQAYVGACATFAVAAWIVHLRPRLPFTLPLFGTVALPSPRLLATWFAASIVVSGAVAVVARSPPPRAFLTVHRAVVVIFLLYVVTAGVPLYGTAGSPERLRFEYLQVAEWAAMVCGLFALYRPALALPLLLYVLWFRLETDALHRLDVESLDYVPVLTFGLLLVVSSMVSSVSTRAVALRRGTGMGPTDRSVDDAGTPMLVVVLLFCTAYYAASYFHSAMAKLTLPGPANAWVTENQTFALIPVSHTAGTLPIATLGRAPEIVYGLAREFSLVLNGLTLAVELCAVIVIARFRWLAIASVCWVLFHLAIFALSGIFFWKWALLDVVLAWVFWRLRGMRLSAGISLTAICIVVMTPRMLPTAHLGWYDTHSFKNSYFVAVTERGEKVRVPTNYFLSASLTMVQLRFVTWLGGPKLPTNVFGTSRDYQVKTAANECRLGPRPVQGTFAARTWDRLARFIRAHHAYVLSRVDGEGRLAYDLYPHHVWSNPGLFRAFADLDKRTIASYEFVMEQLCVGYAEGGLFNRYLSAESRPIVVR